MTSGVLTYPCSGCGASMVFDAASQGLSCRQCGGQTPVALPRVAIEELDLEAALAAGEGKPAEPGSRCLRCTRCAAELEASGGLEARPCPFCGSALVLEDAPGDRVLAPEGVLPFRIEREKAQEAFRTWVRKRWFAPSGLRKLTRADLLRGVYVPFWTFDARADSPWNALSGTYYYTTEMRRGPGGRIRMQRVRHVRWWPSSGRHAGAYDDVRVCASKGLKGSLSGIEFFSLDAAVPYEPRCLAGWEVEACSVGLRESWSEASARIYAAEERACAAEVPGDTHMGLQVRTRLSDLGFKPVLLPVWVGAYRYGGKDFRFLVNGQTGAHEGEAPVSPWKAALAVLGLLALVVGGIWLSNR